MRNPTRIRPVYRVEILRPVRKQLLRLPEYIRRSMQEAIDSLALEPRPVGVRKLRGREGYRIPIGDYRVIYLISDAILLVEITKVGPRGNFYDD